MTDAEKLAFLRDPKRALPACGRVLDQATSQFVRYDPYRLTKTLQGSILDYFSDPPRTDDGQTRFLTVLTARQMGKSLTAEYACYPKAAYIPGWDHVTIADVGDRANYLHTRIHQLHAGWPEGVKSPTIPNRESRQLTFNSNTGGKMRVLSAESGAVGIGQSPDSAHFSECPFWADFGGSMSLINPSIINRSNALVCWESTPLRANDDWHLHCQSAKKGDGRHLYLFAPFWDGYLNRRTWKAEWTPTLEELRLFEKYSPAGLEWDNLAFRRFVLDSDAELRRDPNKFNIFYPFDDLTCWPMGGGGAIPGHALQKHIDSPNLIRSERNYIEFFKPDRECIYVIGADPCGYAARDHAAFQVLRVNDGEWEQVAAYSAHTDPEKFARALMAVGKRFNNAMIAVESTGVGHGTLTLLREWGYKNLVYDKNGLPGVPATAKSLEQWMAWTTDALMDELILHDYWTVDQLMTYRNDKQIEENQRSEMIRGTANKKRRDRHHWDKVSALFLAISAARQAPKRQKRTPALPVGDAPIHSGIYNAKDQAAKWRAMKKAKVGSKYSPKHT